MFGENSERERKRERRISRKQQTRGGKTNSRQNFLFPFSVPRLSSEGGQSYLDVCATSRARETTERERARVLYIYITLYYIFVEKRETEDKER